jgi:hypothetical protein
LDSLEATVCDYGEELLPSTRAKVPSPPLPLNSADEMRPLDAPGNVTAKNMTAKNMPKYNYLIILRNFLISDGRYTNKL